MDKSEYKVCEVCGKEKHICEFSKSYPRRCKECVAEHTRMIRKRSQNAEKRSQNTENRTELPKKRTETVKARIKATGEIIDIASYARVTLSKCDSYGDPLELGFDEVEILAEKTDDIDWEQRRYELAKELMKGFASNPHNQCVDATTETLAQWSIGGADALIAELQKPKRYGQTEE